jgi:hypothetical protein
MKKALLVLFPLLAAAACDGLSTPRFCPAVVQPSAQVTVQDSLAGTNITPGATVVLRSGAYVDSVVAQPLVTSVDVGTRAGTFTLTARQSGYQLWTRTGVRVEQGGCGPQTVELTARLRPAPSLP